MKNPNPNCKKECRFSRGHSMTTAMHYDPVYDKHGNNTIPDGNIISGSMQCSTCNRKWSYTTQYDKTNFKEMI